MFNTNYPPMPLSEFLSPDAPWNGPIEPEQFTSEQVRYCLKCGYEFYSDEPCECGECIEHL